MTTATKPATITRQPKYDGYDTLGSGNRWGEDFLLLVNGHEIGGTYFCNAERVKDGERWASYGPAGYSMGHPTREAAEQAQVDACDPAYYPPVSEPALTEPTPELAPLAPLSMPYKKAVDAGRKVGAAHADDVQLMAMFCEDSLQTLVGRGVAPQLVWEGAQKIGLASRDLVYLCGKDIMGVSDLMWIDTPADREAFLTEHPAAIRPTPAPQPEAKSSATPEPETVPTVPQNEDFAQQVADCLDKHHEANSCGDWLVARDSRDNTAAVIWRPADFGGMAGIRGTMLYQWLGTLRDAGFTAEPRMDMEVFGRPGEQSKDRAHWLHVTAWTAPGDVGPDERPNGLAQHHHQDRRTKTAGVITNTRNQTR